MKFAHSFQETLISQDFPPHWVARAIPYHQLKKCLKKIRIELREHGLDTKTLQYLLANDPSLPALVCNVSSSSSFNFSRPELTLHIQLRGGQVVDNNLAPTTRCFLQEIATGALALKAKHVESDTNDASDIVEFPLVVGREFFNILTDNVQNLEALQREELKKMSKEIIALGKEVSSVAKPRRFSKSDVAAWRDIFEIYLEAEVFFAAKETLHGARSSSEALKQLQWFREEVEKLGLSKKFQLKGSQQAFDRFLKLNMSLFNNLQFQELNKTAIYKILKKFDKQTSFSVSKTFPKVIRSDRLLARSVAKEVCAQMSRELVLLIPQIHDYLCPICFAVAWRPIRLDCQHVFCIRCIIHLQRRKENHCPLCRTEVVSQASEDNIDYRLESYLRKYFSREVKQKERSNEIERGVEDFGLSYEPKKCSVM